MALQTHIALAGSIECSWLNRGFQNEVVGWVHVDQNEVEGRSLLNTGMNLLVSSKAGKEP